MGRKESNQTKAIIKGGDFWRSFYATVIAFLWKLLLVIFQELHNPVKDSCHAVNSQSVSNWN